MKYEPARTKKVTGTTCPRVGNLPRPRPQGFSLVEILAAVAIASVLAALLIPAVTRQIEKGRQTACVTKLRNLASVVSQFRAERNHVLWNRNPTTEEGGEGDIAPARIFHRYGLIDSGKDMQCPAATNEKHGAWKTGGSGTPDYVHNIANQYVSYSVNDIAFYRNSPEPYDPNNPVIQTYWHYSGRENITPIFVDGTHFQLNKNSWKIASRFTRLALRHQEQCNVLFLDGHVESMNRYAAERIDPYGGTNPKWMQLYGVQ